MRWAASRRPPVGERLKKQSDQALIRFASPGDSKIPKTNMSSNDKGLIFIIRDQILWHLVICLSYRFIRLYHLFHKSAKCTIKKSPQCYKLQERFLLIQSGIKDERDELLEEISLLENFCEETKKTLETQIQNDKDSLSNAQTIGNQ